jgi:arsenite methyltransferase
LAFNWFSWLVKSPLRRHVVSQLGFPRGPLGRALARMMNQSNLKLSRHALAGLELQAGQTVIEVGFGGGTSLRMLLDAVGPQGKVIGIDRAPGMLKMVRRAFAADIESGRLRLAQADLPAWPQDLGPADAVLGVNLVYFWTEPQACMNTLAAALKPGGRMSLGFRPPEAARISGLDKAGFNTVEPQAVLGWMSAAGLENARLGTLPEGKLLAHAAMASKPT